MCDLNLRGLFPPQKKFNVVLTARSFCGVKNNTLFSEKIKILTWYNSGFRIMREQKKLNHLKKSRGPFMSLCVCVLFLLAAFSLAWVLCLLHADKMMCAPHPDSLSSAHTHKHYIFTKIAVACARCAQSAIQPKCWRINMQYSTEYSLPITKISEK